MPTYADIAVQHIKEGCFTTKDAYNCAYEQAINDACEQLYLSSSLKWMENIERQAIISEIRKLITKNLPK